MKTALREQEAASKEACFSAEMKSFTYGWLLIYIFALLATTCMKRA
jgi:hypothetical protein